MFSTIPKDEISKIKSHFGEDHVLNFRAWYRGDYEAQFSVLSKSLQSMASISAKEEAKSEASELEASLTNKVHDLDNILQKYKDITDEMDEKKNDSDKLEFELASMNEHLEHLRNDLQSLFIGADSIPKSDYEEYEAEIRTTLDEINEFRNQRWQIVERYEQLVDEQNEVYNSGIPVFRDLVLFIRQVCDFILSQA